MIEFLQNLIVFLTFGSILWLGISTFISFITLIILRLNHKTNKNSIKVFDKVICIPFGVAWLLIFIILMICSIIKNWQKVLAIVLSGLFLMLSMFIYNKFENWITNDTKKERK